MESEAVIDGIQLRRREVVAEIILARPEVHNALNLAMWRRLGAVFAQVGRESEVRVIILRGAGGKALSAGADISEFRELRVGPRAADYNAVVANTFETLAITPQPIIASIDGLAVGGGCELIALCDLRIAADTARFGIPINRLGVTAGLPEARALVSLIGPGAAKDLLLTGRLIDAAQAFRVGLVSRVVPPEALEAETWALAERVARGAPLAATVNKLTINHLTLGAPSAATLEALNQEVYQGPDLREGIEAFLQKREPRFGQREGSR